MTPFSSTTLTLGTRMRSLMRCSSFDVGSSRLNGLPGGNVPPEVRHKILDRDDAPVALLVLPDRHRAGRDLFGPDNGHIRYLLEFAGLDLSGYVVLGQINFAAQSGVEQLLVHLLGVGGDLVRHRRNR